MKHHHRMSTSFTSGLAAVLLAVGVSFAQTPTTGEKSKTSQAKAPAGEWQTIFNGKDLTGWKHHCSYYEYKGLELREFFVEDGQLKTHPKEGDRWGVYLAFEEPLRNFEISYEVRSPDDATQRAVLRAVLPAKGEHHHAMLGLRLYQPGWQL